MSTSRTSGEPAPDWRKPRRELRHWSTYATAGAFYADYRGYVPIQMMQGISRVMRDGGLTFAQAYAALLDAGAIIHLDEEPDPDEEPGAGDGPPDGAG